MRGAAPIDVLSRVFIKCAYLAVESYSEKGLKMNREIFFSREMSSIAPNMGGRIFLR